MNLYATYTLAKTFDMGSYQHRALPHSKLFPSVAVSSGPLPTQKYTSKISYHQHLRFTFRSGAYGPS